PRRPPVHTFFPYTTLFRSWAAGHELAPEGATLDAALASAALSAGVEAVTVRGPVWAAIVTTGDEVVPAATPSPLAPGRIRDTVGDRKSTRLNSSHVSSSYA